MTKNEKTERYLKNAKTIVKFVAGRSVSVTVATIVHQNVTTETKAQKAQVAVGAYVVSEMVAAKTRDYVGDRFDVWSTAFRESWRIVKEAESENN